jgi:hypothetical protein
MNVWAMAFVLVAVVVITAISIVAESTGDDHDV